MVGRGPCYPHRAPTGSKSDVTTIRVHHKKSVILTVKVVRIVGAETNTNADYKWTVIASKKRIEGMKQNMNTSTKDFDALTPGLQHGITTILSTLDVPTEATIAATTKRQVTTALVLLDGDEIVTIVAERKVGPLMGNRDDYQWTVIAEGGSVGIANWGPNF
jgi:hypothetical protein